MSKKKVGYRRKFTLMNDENIDFPSFFFSGKKEMMKDSLCYSPQQELFQVQLRKVPVRKMQVAERLIQLSKWSVTSEM